jgi:hypothetical protein
VVVLVVLRRFQAQLVAHRVVAVAVAGCVQPLQQLVAAEV